MSIYGRLLYFLGEIRKEIIGKIMLTLAVSVTYIVQAVFMAKTVNAILADPAITGIVGPMLIVAAAILVRSGLLRIGETYTKTVAEKIKGRLRQLIQAHIFKLGPGQMNEKRSGEVTALMLDGIENLEPFFVSYVPQVFSVVITAIFAFIYLGKYDMFTTLILMGAMLLCVAVPFVMIPLVERNIDSYWAQYSKLTSQYIDVIQGMTTLKTLNAEETMGETITKDATAFWKRSIRNTGISLANSALMLTLTGVTSSLCVLISAYRAYAGIVPVTTVSLFLFMTIECARPLYDLNRYWHSSFLGLSTAKGLFQILDTIPKVVDNDRRLEGGINDKPSISLENVSFSYIEGEEVLKDVSFDIPGGKKTAIVGRSGAGKSTLFNLLLRHYDPAEGRVLINGEDLKDYGISYLRSKETAVFQDTFLFYGSIEDNIRISKPEATDEEVRKAAELANAKTFIEKTPEGYKTLVGERGLMLSGGERQRISIARAVLKASPILLLDEATASVDADSEKLIQDAIDNLATGCTTVIIAHRLSTVKNADNIVVMDNGRVAEQGTHKELMEKKGTYYELVRAQEEFENA